MKKVLMCGIAIIIVIGACSCSEKTKESNNVDVTNINFSNENEVKERNANELTDKEAAIEDKPLSSTDENIDEKGTEYVGINAHVKENNGNSLLISSDSDDFPGVFLVSGLEEITDATDLQGGTYIQILMQNLNKKNEQGIDQYRAEEITPISEEVVFGQEDILLREIPTFKLCDILSEQSDFTELRSGNYSWNTEENGEGKSVIACGAAPLEEAKMNSTVKLKVPQYNHMDGAVYIFSTQIAPDILTIHKWSAADINNELAMEETIITYYYKSSVIFLQAGKVYEFAAEWKEKNSDKNKFYGNANYVLVTE